MTVDVYIGMEEGWKSPKETINPAAFQAHRWESSGLEIGLGPCLRIGADSPACGLLEPSDAGGIPPFRGRLGDVKPPARAYMPGCW